jgi:uncharacterized protein YjgD (DUF1641 family)
MIEYLYIPSFILTRVGKNYLSQIFVHSITKNLLITFKRRAYSKGESVMSETTAQTNAEQQLTATSNQDLLDQLLKPEVQESLTTLIEQLPKLTEMVNGLSKTYDVVQSLSQDQVFKSDIVGATTEMFEPVIHSVKGMASATIEAKDRADASNETIGVFGLMKMLKDPQAQKMFRFLQSYLQIMSERNNK